MQFPNISPSRFPHRLQVLAVWLFITLLSLLIFNLSGLFIIEGVGVVCGVRRVVAG